VAVAIVDPRLQGYLRYGLLPTTIFHKYKSRPLKGRLLILISPYWNPLIPGWYPSAMVVNLYISFRQNRIFRICITNSSGENTVRPRGRSGAAVAAASRVMSSRPKGTARISRTAA